MEEVDFVLVPIWVINSSSPHDFLDITFPSGEGILEAMIGPDMPWEDLHHRSYFLPDLERIERDEFRSIMSDIVGHIVVPLDKHDIYVEGNMKNISPTIVINISRTPSKVENVHISADCLPEEIHIYTDLFKDFRDIFAWSYEQVLGIDPTIIEHKIKTYMNARPV
jgi:hypothetical protein